MVRLISDDDVASLLDIESLLPVVREAFVKQGRGEVERPDRPHFPVGTGIVGDSPLGTGLVMPAYIHGARYYATKLVGVYEGNADRGLPTVNAQIALTEAETGLPAGFLAGTRITNARTGCIGGIAAAELAASSPVKLGIIGAGTQARWQARCIATATDVESIRVYSPSDSKDECADELESDLDVPATPVESAAEAVADATVVVTTTTATSPVFSGEALEPGTLVIAIGAYTSEMRELDRKTFDRADKTFADVPEEVAEIGDLLATDLGESDLVPLTDVLEDRVGRDNDREIIVVESVGSAVLDAATSEFVFERAVETETSEEVEL
ncbi:ornithine cyclodeaminase family protein [Haladaptatus sp. AB643]|uniref:ornithine cyclodeaminase family protein n=1 Tax=Haladaptatus sp. AB643 TaxID=2934174 RepID=UPI00209C0BA2|nr:ornithine cyclodeaminase family protein [Haladaptatus sp. AB643]MCO8246322.1 ornithine cyclodeaminase family protein [Haladaptatus sp. AB643]